MASLCSVPIDLVVMSGQGIKLTSYIAKKCREKETLMPVIEKDHIAGAITRTDLLRSLYEDNFRKNRAGEEFI